MYSSVCPCKIMQDDGSAKMYVDCCQPLHIGKTAAKSAEQLMRSRYSAFVLALTDYIVNTTLPAQQELLDKQAIQNWAVMTKWTGLEVVRSVSMRGGRHAQVEFKAYYNAPSGQGVHHELSTFVKVTTLGIHDEAPQASWFFLDPTVDTIATQKQPCICGSGEKSKHCCGRYL